MIFDLFPPEINSGLIYTGPGSGSLLAAASAWDSLAADVAAAATSSQSVITNLTTGPWLGPSSAALAAAAAPYVGWLGGTAAQLEQVGAQAKAGAAAFETARAASVPPPVIAANRALLAALVATNLLGQNTPAIAATEAHYMEMWAQDALAMDTYAVSSQQAAALPQHTAAPMVATSNGAQQVAAAAQATATSSTSALQLLSQLVAGINQLLAIDSSLTPLPTVPDSLSGLPTWLSGVGSAVSADLGLTSLTSGGGFATTSAIQAIYLASIPARFALYPMSMLMQLARMGSMGSMGGMPGAGGLMNSEGLLNSVAQLVDGKLQLVAGGVGNQLRTWGSAISAQLASAHSLGGLSVPQAWSSAAAGMSRAAPVLPATSVSAPAVSAPSASSMLGGPFGQALMGALSGRGLGGLAAKVPKVVPRTPAGG